MPIRVAPTNGVHIELVAVTKPNPSESVRHLVTVMATALRKAVAPDSHG